MSGETLITLVGHLTADPELRFTPSGAAVASFTVASTPRSFDRASNEWKDGDPLFMRCTVWRDAAENVAESLRKGMRVIVHGRLAQRTWETEAGERRTSIELRVDEVGPSLRRAKAQVIRAGGQTEGTPVVNTHTPAFDHRPGAVYTPQPSSPPAQPGHAEGWGAARAPQGWGGPTQQSQGVHAGQYPEEYQ